MIAALAFLLLGAPQEIAVRVVCTPAEVEIGQPIECTLEVRHPAAVDVRIKTAELALDDSWLLLEAGRVLTVPEEHGELTRARWVIASLDAGERTLALPTARYDWDGALHGLSAEPARVHVRGALAQGEDAPRPALGFRPPPPEPGPPVPRTLVAGLLGAGFTLVALFFFARLRRGREQSPAAPSPLEELARLKQRALDDPASVQAVHYELSRLVRAAIDRRLEVELRGLTDAEWLARAQGAPGVSTATHGELAELFAVCERVKYGREAPTRWASEATLARACELVEAACSAMTVEELR